MSVFDVKHEVASRSNVKPSGNVFLPSLLPVLVSKVALEPE